MKIAVIGAKGNMGQRYCHILRHLNHQVVEIDIDNDPNEDVDLCDGIIIATPTDQHVAEIIYYMKWSVPILCEKPIDKSLERIKDMLHLCPTPLRMINQYEYYTRHQSLCIPNSCYDYFKTGKDSLYWDCINIIGLSKGEVTIRNKSPIWHCMINGKLLDIGQMDRAYIWNVGDWLGKFDDNRSYIIHAHEKVQEFIDAHDSNRDTGTASEHKA